MRYLLPVLGFFALGGAAAGAQVVGGEWRTRYQYAGGAVVEGLGSSVAGGGDLNADGVPDYAVGLPWANTAAGFFSGAIEAYSGADGTLLWRADSTIADSKLGTSLAFAGDIDRDGHADLVSGATWSSRFGASLIGTVHAFSGADGREIRVHWGQRDSEALGVSVCGAGDFDADGYADYAAGSIAPVLLPWHSGAISVFSGRTGARLLFLPGGQNFGHFGWRLANAGDLNGDGVEELLVSSIHERVYPGGYLEAGRIYAMSLPDQQALYTVSGGQQFDHLGESLAALSDWDGDGIREFIAGATQDTIVQPGYAEVFSGADGRRLLRVHGETAYDFFGQAVAGAGDLDADGREDLLVGAAGADAGNGTFDNRGSVYFFSGATGALLRRVDGPEPHANLGAAAARIGDLHGDGYEETLISAPRSNPGGIIEAGSAFVYGLDPFLRLSAPVLSLSGAPVQVLLDFPAQQAGLPYALLASAAGTGPTTVNGVALPLGAGPLLSRLLSGWSPPFLQNDRGTLGPQGHALAAILPVPALAPFIDTSLHLAAATPQRSSAAQRLRIAP